MRVLHVNKRYPPHIGGIERHVQDLWPGLRPSGPRSTLRSSW